MVSSQPRDGFAARVVAVVAATVAGEVVTYGEVAAEVGRPRAARAVGRVLATCGTDLPWWRVVAAGGRLAPGKTERQADLLEAEGVRVDRVRGRVRGQP
ncbi:MAG: MGMT family protein [Nitriliruptor sp.]|uniref:MGMT family protein n=1 Tax=Nitriliruptor sp. TaxID=2448056 RepID=UPI0034A03EB1